MKKRRTYLAMAIAILVLLLLGIYVGIKRQHVGISYDKQQVHELGGITKSYESSLVKWYETNTPPVTLYGPPPSEWNREQEVNKVHIQLSKGDVRKFGYVMGWKEISHGSLTDTGFQTGILDRLKLPEGSSKVEKHPYFISLAMETGDHILVFFGWHDSIDLGLLTLLYVGQDQAEVVFNKPIDLRAIVETQRGYRLVGLTERVLESSKPSEYCEIVIENHQLCFKKVALQEVYAGKDPGMILYDAVGWGRDKKPGEFTCIKKLKHPEHPSNGTDDIPAVNEVKAANVWTPVPTNIQLPKELTGVEVTPFFITLDEKALILFGRPYEGGDARLLTIFSLPSFRGIPVHDSEFALKELIKTEHGYRLIEDPEAAKKRAQPYEIVIEGNQIKRVNSDGTDPEY